MSDAIKTVGWKYVDYCGNCGSCEGGRSKVIFGKIFERVCGCTFRVDNAVQEDLPFLKKMVDLRMRELAQKAFEGVAEQIGVYNKDDVQALVDEVCYGKRGNHETTNDHCSV